MKTRLLIEMLQKADPSGELEACVGGLDIYSITREQAYYDGALQVLTRNEAGRIVGGKYVQDGSKISIRSMSIHEAITNYGDRFIVDYSGLGEPTATRTREDHEGLRTWMRRMKNELELENFREWVKRKAETITADIEQVNNAASSFFKVHISPTDPLPPGGIPLGMSYRDVRWQQWDEKFAVVVENGFLKVKAFEQITTVSMPAGYLRAGEKLMSEIEQRQSHDQS